MMRALAIAVALFALVRVAAADPFDELPKAAAELATQATTAVDQGDEATLVSLAPKRRRAALKREIDGDGGVAKWARGTSTWKARAQGHAWFVESGTVKIELVPGKQGWRVAAIEQRRSGAAGAGGGLSNRHEWWTVQVARPGVTGWLARKIVKRYLMRNASKLVFCYVQGLQTKPELARHLKLGFVVGTDGVVSTPSATGIDADVASCIEDVVLAIQFPSAADTTRVTEKLTFIHHGD